MAYPVPPPAAVIKHPTSKICEARFNLLQKLIPGERKIFHEHPYTDNMNVMHQCFKDGVLCDVELIGPSNSYRISAHKLVLMSGSEFFLEQFKKPCVKEELKVHVNEEVMKSLVTFCYTGKLEINVENVVNILISAMYLRMKNVEDKCEEFLKDSISIETCLVILALAEYLKISSLSKTAFDFIRGNFSDVSATSSFLILEERELKVLLSCAGLIVQNENIIYEAVKKWIMENQTRIETYASVLELVNISRLSQSCVLDINKNFTKIMNQSTIVSSRVHDSLAREYNMEQMTNNCDAIFRVYLSDKIVVLGGSDGNVERLVETYDSEQNKWIEYMDIGQQVKKNYFSAVPIINEKLNYEILILGGCLDGQELNTMEIVDVTSRSVRAGVPLQTARSHLGAAVIQEKGNVFVYAIGGITKNADIPRNCERWDMKSNKWLPINDMLHGRYQFGIAVLEKKVYVVGGMAEINGKSVITNTVEAYNVTNQTWEALASMQTARYATTLVAVGNYLYAIGGYSVDYKPMTSVEKYDPATNRWTNFTNLPIPLYGMAGCRYYDKILVCGGGDDVQKTVLVYNFETNSWGINSGLLKKERFGASIFHLPYLP